MKRRDFLKVAAVAGLTVAVPALAGASAPGAVPFALEDDAFEKGFNRIADEYLGGEPRGSRPINRRWKGERGGWIPHERLNELRAFADSELEFGDFFRNAPVHGYGRGRMRRFVRPRLTLGARNG